MALIEGAECPEWSAAQPAERVRDEMAIYEGVLKTLSGGSQQVSVDRADHAFVRHEFIEIGDKRIKNVRVLTYHNALLERVIGQTVSLSLYKSSGQSVVVAMRMPDGSVERVDRSTVLMPMIVMGAQRLFVAAIFVVLGLVIGNAAHLPLVTIALVALAVFLVFSWFRTWTGLIAARAAV
jgi:hypothetical protein